MKPSGAETEMTRRAFDAAASVYDAAYEDLPGIRRIRAITRSLYLRHFPAGSSLLEINCGTGNDALFLAQHGRRVLATDLSPAMVGEADSKIAAAGLTHLARTRCLPFERLGELRPEAFDGAYSNMGGLNCTDDLAGVARDLAAVLKPGAMLIATLMPEFCLWETLAFLGRLRWRRAFRRMQEGGVEADLHGGIVRTRYHAPHRLLEAFAPHFEGVATRGLLVFLPPPNFVRAYRMLGRTAGQLGRLDDLLADRVPFSSMGDHYVTVLKRKQR